VSVCVVDVEKRLDQKVFRLIFSHVKPCSLRYFLLARPVGDCCWFLLWSVEEEEAEAEKRAASDSSSSDSSSTSCSLWKRKKRFKTQLAEEEKEEEAVAGV
jgi:hypothetical protein